jgi:PAS domain S-box-containing protein
MRVTGVVFGVTAAVVAGSTLLTYTVGNRVLQLYEQEEKRRHALSTLENLFSTVQDAETGQRGFIITGDESYLEPFKAAQARLPQVISRFRDLRDIGVSAEESQALDTAVKEKMEELSRTLELRRQGGFDAAIGMIKAGSGKVAMDRIRELVARIRNEQEQGLQSDRHNSTVATRERTTIFFASALLTLLVLLWGFLRIRSAIHERDAAVIERQHERDLLLTTLSSIGDCVIVTDVAGNITFMNPVACAVTGWSIHEAVGRPVKDVFHIINEESRQPVEDPVEKVIRSGVIVGLANHTVLIRKDGKEIPIDDSGAPVRAPGGKLEGVVLVFRDFSATKQTQRELVAAKQAAEGASVAKDKFLAMLSHELRTPLTPVLATLSAWEAEQEVPANLQPDVQMLRRNVELEARMIDDLLDLTRISRGMLSFHPELVDVHSIIDLLVSMIRVDIDAKQLKLNVRLDAPRHNVMTDTARLQQILWNLVRNAVNFSDAGGTVTIQTSNDNGHLLIVVEDTGVGMSSDTLQRLFTPFEQADRGRSVRYGGLGLGLAISHALVEQMGGTIKAESGGLGKGSKFVLQLNLAVETVAPTAPAQPAPAAARTRRILLVEDHVDTALTLTRLLKLKGHEVHAVGTLAEANQAVESNQFDLLVCDIGLPDGTGYDLIKTVRQRNNLAAIAITGFGMASDVERAMEAGFDAHLTKPIDLQRLEAAIAESEKRRVEARTPK